MGLLARSVLARDAIAALIIVGILMILVGELSVLDRLLRGSTRLPSVARKSILALFVVLSVGSISLLFSSWTSRIFTSPRPLWNGLIENVLFFGLAAASFLVVIFLNALASRWAVPAPDQVVPPPARRGWVRRKLLIGSGMGLLMVLLAGAWLDATGLDDGWFREPASLALSFCVMGCMAGLVVGLVRPFWAWLRWWIKYLPPSSFLRVGACLLVLGIVMLGLASWLVL